MGGKPWKKLNYDSVISLSNTESEILLFLAVLGYPVPACMMLEDVCSESGTHSLPCCLALQIYKSPVNTHIKKEKKNRTMSWRSWLRDLVEKELV